MKLSTTLKRGLLRAVITINISLAAILSGRGASLNWTNVAGGVWNTAANWSPNQIPGPNDTAVITNAGVTVSLNGATTVGAILLGTNGSGTVTLSLNGQSLALNGPLTVYPSGSFTVDGGALVGNTNAVLSGTMGWSAGFLEGVLTLAPGSTLNVFSANNHDLPGCTLTNFGTVTWASGAIRGGNNGTVYNYGLWDAQSDQLFCPCGYGGGEVFNNYGTFRKSGGASEFASATTFQGGVVFNQLAGVLDVQNGTNGLELAFQNGGSFTGGYITTNQFGLTVLSAGDFNLNGTVTGTNTWLDAGNLVGDNVINGALTWVGGVWNGAPSVTITTNSTLLVIGAGNHDLPGCTLSNFGTVTWASGAIRGGNNGTVYNYGLWDAQSDQLFCPCGYGGGAVFNNYGTFRKSGGASEFASATTFQGGAAFNQLAGVLDVQNGTNGLELAFQSGGNFTGGYITTNQFGLTVLSAGNFNLNGTVTGTNTWLDAGNLVGNNAVNGALTWVGGVWNGAGVTIANNSAVIVAGGSGNMDMNAATVTNYGMLVWASGTIRGGTGTVVDNFGLWDAQSDQTFNDAYGGETFFNNFGTFRKSAGAGSTLFASGVLFTQTSGLLDVQNGNLVLQGSGSFTGGSLNNSGAGTTYLSAGSFNLNGASTTGNVVENAGNLVGDNVINGSLTWVAGNWNSATVTIRTNSVVTVAGGGGLNDLNAAAVTNYGTLSWASGTIRGGDSTVIDNFGLWDAQSDQTLNAAYGGSATFNNFGTFRKSGGASEFASATLIQGFGFNQLAGLLDVQNGTNGLELALQGGGTFSGGYLTTNSQGLTVLSAGSFNLNGTVTGVNTWESGGLLVGTNAIRGALTWVGGDWNNAPCVTITTNATLVVTSAADHNLPSSIVTNSGTVMWKGGNIRGGNGTAIYNYGLWDAQSDQTLNDAYGGGSTFNNRGTFRKSAGVNTTTVDNGISFLNPGTVGALSGTLQFNSSPAFAGGVISFGIGGSNLLGRVNVVGTASLAGGIGAVLLNGYIPAVGSQFAVMNFGSTNGTFTDYSGLNAGGGVAFTPMLSPTSVILSTVATNFTPVAPTIISQPQGLTANYGDTVTLQVTVSGSPTLLFQWNRDKTPLLGATNSTLTLSNVTFAQQGAYTVGVTNSAGGVLSQVAQLTVVPVLPSFTSQPQSITVPAGSNATFNVTVIGEPPPFLRWQFNGTNLVEGGRIGGSSSTNLSLTNVHFSDAGNYSVIATNGYGAATSSVAVLHVGFPDLAPFGITAPTNATLGQTIPLVFSITNSASGRADGPWLNQFLLAADTNGTSAYNMGTATFNGSIPAFSFITVTQSVIMPANIFGTRYFGMVVNSSTNLPELTMTNNTAFAVNPIAINAADLALEQLSAPGSAQYGQNLTVNFAVTNIGTASALAGWSDQIYFSSTSNSLSGATLLATLAGTSPLAPGAGYVRNQTVAIPQTSTSTSGTFYLLVVVDPGNGQLETNKANNLLSTPLTLSLPPLPDLVVGQVSSPTNAAAGQSIPVSWAVTNLGGATANGPWQETVYLVPANLSLPQFNTNVTAYPAIGVFTFTNSLAAGTTVTRTQQVALPLTGLAGDLRVAVLVNSDNRMLEQNATNDSALALNDLQVPAALSLSLPVTTIPENTSTPNLACLVSRNGSLASPVVVALASSASNHLVVPASATIPAGAASAPFQATVLDDGLPGPDALVTVSASASGYLGSTSAVTVVNTDVPYLSLSLASSLLTESQTVLATVTNSPVSSQPVVVSLTSSSAGALTTPSSVTIPAYSNAVSFTVLAVQNTLIAPAQTYTLNASASGYLAASASLTVLNNNAPALALSLDNTNINGSDGPFAAIGTISRLPVSDQSVVIALTSTNPGAATVPARVTIPSLQGSVSFYVAAVNNTNVTGPNVTLLSAQALDSGGNAVGNAATQMLVVEDVNGPSLKLTLANKVVAKGLNPATTGTISVAPPPTNNILVTLTSSATGEATVPATVTILAGQTNISFNIASLNDGLPATTHQVTITASASNYANGHDVLAVTDLGLPDLVVSSITVPAAAYTAEPMTIGFRLLNQGLGPLTNGVNQNVYLTQDPASGNYLPMGTAYFQGPLVAGKYVDQSLVVPGSALPLPGTYSVVVIADANNNAVELNEANNNLVSQAPVVISPEYTATVQAGVATVLSGTPVPLTGSATLAFGGPATNKPVNILIVVRGLQRVLSVLTDANGNFSTVFNPLPNEAGNYTVAAVFPGITSAPAQDQFNILGISATPASVSLNVTEGSNSVGSVSLQNLGEVPLSGLLATVNGLAGNLQATAFFSTNYLAGQAAVVLFVSVSAVDSSIRQSAFTVHVTSSEGAVRDVPATISVNALTPNLFAPLSPLSASMVRGGQTLLQMDVVNNGGAPSGPLSINLPSVPWLSVASTNPLPSIAPGATNHVTLLLSPDANLALGPYSGSLSVIGSAVGLQVPFTFTAVSDAHGGLSVLSVDEYTYFATGSPPLTNATVTLLDPFTKAVVASGLTDTNGMFNVAGVMEGVYELDLSADQHVPFRGEAVISAGQTKSITAFLSRQTVTYVWTVVPTSIQDTNHITIQATFETDVPAPVVVPDPASIDLAPLTQPGQFMDIPFTLANYGLIAVQNVTINITQHPLYRFDLLTTDVGTLPAHGTVTIPMRITRLAGPSQPARTPAPQNLSPGAPCNINFGLNYSYPCGPFGIEESVQVTVLNVSGDCSTTPGYSSCSVSCVNCGSGDGGYGFMYNPNNGGRGGNTVQIPPSFSLPPSCDPCWDAARDCIIGFIPVVGCVYSAYQGCLNGNTRSVENCTFAAIGCVGGDLGNVAACLQSVLRCICPESDNCWSNFVYNANAHNSLASLSASVGTGFSNNDLRDVYWARSYAGVALLAMTLGDRDGRWFSSGSGGAFSTWYNGFTAAVQSGSASGVYISPAEAANLLTLPVPNTVSNADVVAVINRWNLTLTNWDAGILSPTNAVAGAATNFIDFYAYTNLVGVVLQQYQISQAAGYASPVAGLIAAMQASGKQAGSVCARVVLQIDQDAVLTRDAFRATLQLNNSSTDPLSNLSVNLVVQNTLGQDVSSLFGIEAPSVSGNLTGVDGTGSLAPSAAGSAQWTLIPSLDAAPQAPTNYLVSGTFSYVQNGATVSIPLSPAPINVQPNPELYLKYFLQRDVFADDPFTPAIEPSIPFPLAVMVQNKGYGVARNFQITSAQPTIVDNEKGLLINFKIIGTQVAGQSETPSLTANFGELAPQSSKVGEWLFLSSLQGLFIDYQATFEHIDPLGNPRLSLIQGVEIHQMVHLVQAAGAWEDGQPDFLTVETPNYLSLPDTLYLSDGTRQPVSVVQTGATDGPANTSHLQVQFTANFPAGFTYVVVADPADGQFPLVGVQDGNGTNLLTPNFYVTDRTFIGLGQRPLDENRLHLFDYHTNAGTYTYTLIYQPAPAVAYTNPPVSSMFSLPAQSPPSFGVAWSGAPFVGQAPLAYFDIYSSDNGGPYTLWQGHTTATGAFFSGTNGHTYAFYSIATDTVGNREAIPLQAQAQTTVNATNYLPTISVAANVTINAGQTLSLNVTAGDPNPFANLTFSLGAGAPAGMSIDLVTGQVTWPTSPAFGGTTNHISIIVSDNSQPPLTATGLVSIAVIQVINPPVLAPIGNYTINEGTLLTFTASATDSNLPPRSLRFSLGAGAPTNAAIDPNTGLFQWRPGASQAPSTNLMAVVVTDNGVPPLSATQQFKVVVRAVEFEFVLNLDSTNVLAGGTVSVPVGLLSSLPLTNITALLQLPSPGLSNFILQAVSPEIVATLLQPVGTNQYQIELTLNPALSPGNSRTLAQLGFTAAARAHSAILPLSLPSLSGFEADGSAAPKPGTSAGAVFVIAGEPLLNAWLGPDSRRELTLFGNPGTAYEVDYTTNLQATNWQFGWRVPMTNTFAVFDANESLPQLFYRAVSFSANPPILELNSHTPNHLVLLLYGQSGTNYTLTSGTNLLNSTNWSPMAGFVLTNSFQFINAGGTTDQMRFFRAKRP